MSVRSGQSITVLFTTRRFDSGAATNADSTPTGTLYVNGVFNAASVTVSNVTTGVYSSVVTLPTLAVGDVVDLRIAATVNSVADNAIVWRDSKDVVIDSAGLVDANTVKVGPTGSGTAQTARDLGTSVLLSSGTGTGQLDFTSGVVKANATQWLGGTIPAVNVTGVPKVDVADWLGTAPTTPSTAGTPIVDVGRINNIATTSVTTVSANVGTTQPINFSGTGATAYVKGDLEQWIGTAPLALTSQQVQAIVPDTQKVDLNTLKTQTITCAASVTVLASVGTATTSTAQTGDSFARIGAAGAGLTALGDTRLANLDSPVSGAALASVWTATLASHLDTIYGKLPTNGLADETLVLAAIASVQVDTNDIQANLPNGLTDDGFIKADIASIQTSLTHAGYLHDIAGQTRGVALMNGAITDATITAPAEASGRPTTILSMIRRMFEWASNKRTRDRDTGIVLLRNSADNGTLETQTQSTVSTTDTISKGV